MDDIRDINVGNTSTLENELLAQAVRTLPSCYSLRMPPWTWPREEEGTRRW